jgi:hypothetical protein
MEPFRVRTDLQRAVVDGFALPLGIAPGRIKAPAQGYTVEYGSGEGDDPDTYSFYVVVSHERVKALLHRALGLLPDRVFGIVEISSRDAYRPIDVFVGREAIPRRRLLSTWRRCEAALLEDASIAAGANSEDPFVEVFLDQWKGLSIIVPLPMREQVEAILGEFALEEVPETWAVGDDNPALEASEIRPVLADAGGGAPDIDDVLIVLRRDWGLELTIDRDKNLDGAGRNLGLTLWHALVGVEGGPPEGGNAADLSIWATAGSLHELETLIEDFISVQRRWDRAEVHLVTIDPHLPAPPR